jgi:mycothiol synthase
VKRHLARGDIAVVTSLLKDAAAHDGHAPLGEHQWLDLVQGGREGFAGLVGWEPGHDHPVGYAQVTRGNDSWALELVVDPHHRDREEDISIELLSDALSVVSEEGGGHVHLWVYRPTDRHNRIASAVGLRRGRDLLQLRRPLPVDEPWELETRPFVTGMDEQAWLDVNNRAFRQHPEQGGWTMETIREREHQPWFDPSGFLIHEREGRIAGFCWTKVHRRTRPPMGEIYVIAVDPDFAGKGLGRALVLAGLDNLARRGITVAMLYVDADNAGAVHLYHELGFVLDHVDRAYVGDVEAASADESVRKAN